MLPDANATGDPLWRHFERLAVHMVSQVFKLKPNIVYVTKQSKDGGYDGVVLQDLTSKDLFELEHLTYVEAKLRLSTKAIGLRDFAATLVIALNDAAQTLVVVANKKFTEQALDHAHRFFSRTNVRVKLVDGPTVSGWLRRHYDELKTGYPSELLELLILNDPEEEKIYEYRYNSRPFKQIGGESNRDLTELVLRTGWGEDNIPADCELKISTAHPLQDAPLIPLIGERRQKLVETLCQNLLADEDKGPIVILTGTGGVGKSVLVSHVLLHLTDRHRVWTSKVDVGRANSSRALFIEILTALFGVDPRTLTEGRDEYWEAEHLIAKLGGDDANPAMQRAVKNALKKEFHEYENSWDLNTEPLLAFLEQIVINRSRSQSLVFVFHELNKSTTETLDFLYQASQVLSAAGASVLLEVRDQGYELTASRRDAEGQLTVILPDEWNAMVRRFRAVATGGEYHVEGLLDMEAAAYLNELVPGLGPKRAKVITSHVGKVPLHLRLTADWHKREGILKRHDGEFYLVEDLERFFAEQNITPKSVDVIFDRVIESWWRQPEPAYRNCIAAAGLLQGRLPYTAIELLAESPDIDEFIESLTASGLFSLALDNRMDLEVTHDLIRERMAAFQWGRSAVHAKVARILLPKIKSIYPDRLTFELRTVDLLEALGESKANEIFAHASIAADALSETRDWSTAARYYEKACLSLGGCTGVVSDPALQIQEIRTLAKWLEVEVLRYRIGTIDNSNRLNALLVLLRLPGSIDQSSIEYQTLAIRAAILEWRYYYVREAFDEALEVATRGRQLALSCNTGVEIEVRGKALANYGVSLKVKDRKIESFEAFDEALRILPESYTVQAERLSNIAAFALRDAPHEALRCYRELLEITHDTPYSFSEIIHAHVDVSMADFLIGDTAAAERDAQKAILLALHNGVPAEEARGLNILGCTLWTKGDIEGADRAFGEAAFASERSISHRFLWRMRTNEAGTALERGDTQRASALAHSAAEAILTPRADGFKDIAQDATHMTARWYAALIAIGNYYEKLNNTDALDCLLERVALPQFSNHLEQFIKGSPPEEVFGHTTHLQAGRIMITG